jgi:glycogen synthase
VRVVFPKPRHTVCHYKTDTFFIISGKLTGVVNGIDLDEWSPDADDFLLTDGYAQFAPDATGLQGKLECKRALQKQLGLPVRDDVPLLGFIGRLDHQKGVDLITDAAGWLLGQDVQVRVVSQSRGLTVSPNAHKTSRDCSARVHLPVCSYKLRSTPILKNRD